MKAKSSERARDILKDGWIKSNSNDGFKNMTRKQLMEAMAKKRHPFKLLGEEIKVMTNTNPSDNYWEN
jgi:hypothetical protein